MEGDDPNIPSTAASIHTLGLPRFSDVLPSSSCSGKQVELVQRVPHPQDTGHITATKQLSQARPACAEQGIGLTIQAERQPSPLQLEQKSWEIQDTD
jgi:hypothetical protein